MQPTIMPTDDELLKLYRAACARCEAARAVVVQWMDDEGTAGRLRTNSQAPGWSAYEKALEEKDILAEQLGGMI